MDVFILNLTECYQLMQYKRWDTVGTTDAAQGELLSELCHHCCLLHKTLYQRRILVFLHE